MALRRWHLAYCPIWRYAYMKGELVYALSQRRTDPIETPGPWGAVHGGYCLGLATDWLSLRKGGRDFDYNRRKRIFDAPIWKATMYQNIQSQQPGTQVRTAFGDIVPQKTLAPIQAAHMSIADVRDLNQVDPAGIRLATTRCPGFRYLLALYGNHSGHAVAVHHDGEGPMRFFDPNYGHFIFKDGSRLERWMRYFLRESHYGSRYTRAQIILVD